MAALPLGLTENVHKRLYGYVESGDPHPVLRVSKQIRKSKVRDLSLRELRTGQQRGTQWSSSPPRVQGSAVSPACLWGAALGPRGRRRLWPPLVYWCQPPAPLISSVGKSSVAA